MVGLCRCTRAFSSCREQGLLCSCGAQAFHCGGFSCCRTQAPGMQASVAAGTGLQWLQCMGLVVVTCRPWSSQAPVVVSMALVAPWHVESSRTRNGTCVPYIGRGTLYHYTTEKSITCSLKNSGNTRPKDLTVTSPFATKV